MLKSLASDHPGSLLSLLVLCGALLLYPAILTAEDAKPAADKNEAVQILFDGKTLTGWEVIDFGGNGIVEVREGALQLGQGDPITGVAWKGDALPKVDYEFTMQARKVDGTDFFATLTFPVQNSHCSLVLGGWGGGLIGLSSLDGSDASENETTDYFTFEKNRWYQIRVRVTKSHIQAWIDDKQIANVDYADKKVSVRIEMERSKPLGISSYQTVGEVRELQIKRLPASKQDQADQ